MFYTPRPGVIGNPWVADRYACAASAPAGQALLGLPVFGRGLGDDVRRQLRGGRGLVPVQGFEIVADELLVETGGAAAGAVLVLRPEAGGVRGEHLVDQMQPAVRVQAELELGIGDDDAPLPGVFGACPVNPQAGVPDLFRQLTADEGDGAVEVDILVVFPGGGLGRGGVDGLRQLVRLFQSRRQADTADRPRALIILPARADE